MRLLIVLVLWFVLLLNVTVAAQPAAQLPELLRDWQGWVRHDQEYRDCPLMSGADAADEGSYLCAWPGELELQVDDEGARFSQTWVLYRDGAVPLPGAASLWPQSVRVDGQDAAVVDREATPTLWLAAGSHRVDGRLRWEDRPESIVVDQTLARISLIVDGKAVFPLQRDAGALWLGRADSGTQEADSLDVQVFRMLSDQVPQRLLTTLRVRASGKGREETLLDVLPADFVPISLDGDLIARYESDDSLHLQLRPGTHEINLIARATKPLASFAAVERAAPWPAEEIWSYQSQQGLRVSDASGPAQMDPAMAEVPVAWRALPAFEMTPGAVLTINERSRGLSEQDQNRLNLRRELWLDYAGNGWTGKDQISGTLMRDWRLDLAPPFQLTRADENNFALLVTAGAKPGWTGVEVRERNLSLTASTRVSERTGALPVTGWQHAFESVTTRLNFPPGYELIAAPGADRAPAAWLDRWDLLDVFVAALIAFLCALAFGRLAALIPFGYLLLAWHLPEAPHYSLLWAVGAVMIAAAVKQGDRLPRWLWRFARALALVLALIAVPFAAQQVRQALYPQLESNSLAYADTGVDYQMMRVANEVMPMAPPPSPPPLPSPAPEQEAEMTLDSVMIAGSTSDAASYRNVAQSNAPQKLKRYDSNTIVQAGGGEPTWQWRSYDIEIAGPVVPTQEVRLLISPPWLTRLARLLIAALLALTLGMVLRAAFRGVRLRSPAPASLLLVLIVAAGGASASEIPSDEMLARLGERVLAQPVCAPNCGHLARADIAADGIIIRAALELHAVERIAMPLPSNDALLELVSLKLDGVDSAGSVRDQEGTPWILVPRGVHRATLEWRAANADSIALRFPQAPGWVEFSGEGWQASGIDQGQLSTGSLELTRIAGISADGGGAGVAQRFAPFVIVTRALRFDLDWSLTTTVQRLSPQSSAFSVAVPLLESERVMSTGFQLDKGVVTVPFGEDQQQVQWESRLDAVGAMSLTAPDQVGRAEVWRLDVSPTWNVVPEGVPGVHPQAGMHEFHPLPGEVLTLKISRPTAVRGNTLAIDDAHIISRVGKRSSEHELSFSLRATQGGQHPIGLPADADVIELRINQQMVNIRPRDGKLNLPITPGNNSVLVKWRDGTGAAMRIQTPTLALNAQASNLDVQLIMPADRWLIATSGPRVGPAVLYWGELLVMIVLAWGLSRTRRTPLRLVDWLLLGIGFSMVSWWALVIFAGWLFALDWRAGLQPNVMRWRFNLVQIGLLLLTLVAASCLFGAIHGGLLGTPDLHVTGNGSYASHLRWFHDQTESVMPIGTAITLPMWLYRALMLAWAFWMAWALIRWVRWGLQSFIAQGVWYRRPRPVVSEVVVPVVVVEAPVVVSDPPRDPLVP